ncbi:MAG: hypothetical protein IKT37_07785 [Clostridia bacterium]|nr:hypothetical protein [Clostridia bacterium]
METKYFVSRAFRYASSKNWEYSLVGAYDTLEAAKQAFHDNMARIIKNTNDICMCIIFDSFGNRIDSDFASTVEPEPVEE